jgi:NADPH-dependent 2,4-dienoyl-CoA reductase/sulfur reductase-like enzyme
MHYKYVIVGGGMTADAAVAGIREVDPAGSIAVVGSEPHRPYNRPPLSKALWKGQPLDSIWRRTKRDGVELRLGQTVASLDIKQKQATDSQGTAYTWDKLLLATGGTPRRLGGDGGASRRLVPVKGGDGGASRRLVPEGGGGRDRVIYYRTLDDYERLRALTERGQRFAVIGGGFIGWEIAAALAMNKKDVVMLFPGEGIGDRVYPRDLSLFLNDFYREHGVDVLPQQRVTAVDAAPDGAKAVVRTQSGREMSVDGVVAGLGIEPNVGLARAASLDIENGIVVDPMLRTTHPDVYAAGDVAAFYNPALGRRIRVEHEDNANTMGKAAGRSMAGDRNPYHHLPFFYSDLFDLGYEAVGDLNPRLETFADWKERHREGVVYYLDRGRVRGVLLWNTWDQVDAARRLIAEERRYRPGELQGRLPERK